MCMETGPALVKPEVLLQRSIKDGLGVDVDAHTLKLYILLRWKTVAALAHAIHDADTQGESRVAS